MPNNCLSVLYKRIIQVENKNVGLKVGGTNIPLPPPPNQKSGGLMPPLSPPPPPPPPPPLPTPVCCCRRRPFLVFFISVECRYKKVRSCHVMSCQVRSESLTWTFHSFSNAFVGVYITCVGVSLGVCLSVNHLLGLVTAIYERRTCVVSNRPTYSLALLCNSPSHRMSLCLFSVSGGARGGGGGGEGAEPLQGR